MTFFFNTIYSIYTILSRKINLLRMDTTNYYLFNRVWLLKEKKSKAKDQKEKEKIGQIF